MEEERIPNFYLENEKMSKNLLTEREVKNYPVVERLSFRPSTMLGAKRKRLKH